MAKKIIISPIFKPLLVTTNKPADLFTIYKLETSKAIVEAVLHCIKYNKSKMVFAEVAIPNSKEIISLNIDENSFLESLDKNLNILEEYEEYELCAELVKAKEKILKGYPNKAKKNNKKEAADNLINTIKNL